MEDTSKTVLDALEREAIDRLSMIKDKILTDSAKPETRLQRLSIVIDELEDILLNWEDTQLSALQFGDFDLDEDY